jgi:ABC-type microcin C transport system permease subunit YejE
MLMVVIGITYGALIGLFGNWLLFRKLEENKRRGLEPLKGIGTVFLLRYVIDAALLLLFGLITKHTWAIISAALSLTLAVKISLFMVYMSKGGKLT